MRLHATVGGAAAGSDAIVLLHGFGTTSLTTWWPTGWITALEGSQQRWVAIDLPAHGGSDRPHDPGAYRSDHVVAAIDRVLDEHGLERVALFGYSFGGELALRYASARSQRVRCVVAGGVGTRRLFGPRAAAGLRAHVEHGQELTDPALAIAWSLATRVPGHDARALLALIEGAEAGDVTGYGGPTLLFRGAHDEIARGSEELALALRAAEHVLVEGRDHLTTLSARPLKEQVSRFLQPTLAAG